MQPIQTLSVEILSQQGQKQFEARISGQLLPNSDLQKTNQRGHFCHFWVKATALRAGVSSERQELGVNPLKGMSSEWEGKESWVPVFLLHLD